MFDGTQTLLYKLYPGDLVGELSMMGVTKRTASIYTVEDTLLLTINERIWNANLEKASFHKKINAILLHRYIETTKVVSRLGQSTVIERLGTYLLTLPEWHEHNNDYSEVTLPSHVQFACLLNCTRERVSGVMRKLYDLEAISKSDNHGKVIIFKSKLTAVLIGVAAE